MAFDAEYLGEFRRNWRVLAAASLGMAVGLQLFGYITSIFAPFLIKEFHWPRAQFALIGFTMLATLPALPIAGRLTDRLGARRMALVGVLVTPLAMLAFARMNGSFGYYFACSAAVLAIGSLTGPVTYTRLIVEKFQRARGLALTIVMCAPALVGVIAPPGITRFVEDYGWRSGYGLLAGIVLIGGLSAIALIPKGSGEPVISPPGKAATLNVRGGFGEVVRSPVFWIIFAAILLCTVHTPLHGSQFVVMLNEQGLDALGAATMIQLYAMGTVVGRIGSGLALDRFPARIVAVISMILPAAGLALIASPANTPLVIGLGVILVGVTVGAEGDLMSFLVGRYFRLEVFSTALALCYCALYTASALGVLMLRGMLQAFDSFSPFLWLTAAAVLAGSLLFLLLPDEVHGSKDPAS